MGNIFKKDFIGYFFISIIVVIVLAHFASKYFHIGKFEGILNYLLLVAGIWVVVFGFKALITKRVYINPFTRYREVALWLFGGEGNMEGKKAQIIGLKYILMGILLLWLFLSIK